MNTRDTKLFNCYTQSQRSAARVLFIVWLLTSCSPDMALAAPKTEGAMVPATTATRPGDLSLTSTPPTPSPGGTLQLPPDSLGSLWSSGVASRPAMERAPQQRTSQRAVLDKGRDLLRTSSQVTPPWSELVFPSPRRRAGTFSLRTRPVAR
ncbi:MAG: hypothetical protein AAF400_02820 [Bacteroidota bacterium]